MEIVDEIHNEKAEKMGIGDWGLGIGPNPQSPIQE